MKYFLLFVFFSFQLNGSFLEQKKNEFEAGAFEIVSNVQRRGLTNSDDLNCIKSYLYSEFKSQIDDGFELKFSDTIENCSKDYWDENLGNFLSDFVCFGCDPEKKFLYEYVSKYFKLIKLQECRNSLLFAQLFILDVCRHKENFLETYVKKYDEVKKQEKNKFKLLILGSNENGKNVANTSLGYIYKIAFEKCGFSLENIFDFKHVFPSKFYETYYLSILVNSSLLVEKLPKNKKYTQPQICNVVKAIENQKLTKEVKQWNWIFEFIDKEKFENGNIKYLFDILEVIHGSGNDHETFSRLFKNNITSILTFYNQYTDKLKEPVSYFFENILKQDNFNFSEYDTNNRIPLFLYQNYENKVCLDVLNTLLEKKEFREYLLSCFSRHFNSFFDALDQAKELSKELFIKLITNFISYEKIKLVINLNALNIKKFLECSDRDICLEIERLLSKEKYTYNDQPCNITDTKTLDCHKAILIYCKECGMIVENTNHTNNNSDLTLVKAKKDSLLGLGINPEYYGDYVHQANSGSGNDARALLKTDEDLDLAQLLGDSLNPNIENNNNFNDEDLKRATENSLKIDNSLNYDYDYDYDGDEDSDLIEAVANSLDLQNGGLETPFVNNSLLEGFCDWLMKKSDTYPYGDEFNLDLLSLIITKANDKKDCYICIDQLQLLQDIYSEIFINYSILNNPLKRCHITKDQIERTTKEDLASCIFILKDTCKIIDENTQFKVGGSDVIFFYEDLINQFIKISTASLPNQNNNNSNVEITPSEKNNRNDKHDNVIPVVNVTQKNRVSENNNYQDDDKTKYDKIFSYRDIEKELERDSEKELGNDQNNVDNEFSDNAEDLSDLEKNSINPTGFSYNIEPNQEGGEKTNPQNQSLNGGNIPTGKGENIGDNNLNPYKTWKIASLLKDRTIQKTFLFFLFGPLIIHLLCKQIQKYKISPV